MASTRVALIREGAQRLVAELVAIARSADDGDGFEPWEAVSGPGLGVGFRRGGEEGGAGGPGPHAPGNIGGRLREKITEGIRRRITPWPTLADYETPI